ncbi:hypothetical protein [Streptomyces rubiginosohelvolus]|uniref:hypothetical protein n=1 Tax=Streptomyces rubiginosohelvolus TaxID=67362 RepID=UPI0033E989A2
MVTAVSAWLFAFALDYFSAEQTTRRAMEVEENVDREGDAFTVSVRKEAIELPSAYVLDRSLSPQEERQLMSIDLDKTHLDEVEELVASVDGHRLDGPGLYESDGYVETWLMDFFSDRQAGLAVTGLRARDLECRPAAARTVILVVYEGGGGYDGIHFDLSRPSTPLALDPGNNLGKPYFSHKKIDLGNGATPGGLRAEVSPGIEDCSFLFEAEYRDAKGTHLRKIDHNGRRFHVRGIPAEPEQVYVITIEGVINCGEKPWPKVDNCPRLPFAKGNWSHT